MLTTTPSANGQPQTVQYTPKDASAEKSVGAFNRPSSSSLPFVSANATTNLIFQTNRPKAPSGASQRAQCEPAGGAPAPCASTTRESATTFSVIAACWRESGEAGRARGARRRTPPGDRPGNAPPPLPRPARAAPARTRGGGSRDTRADPARSASRSRDRGRAWPGSSRSRKRRRRGRLDAERARDSERHAAVQLPRLVKGEPDDEDADHVLEAGQERKGERDHAHRDGPDETRGHVGPVAHRGNDVGHVLGADAEVGDDDRECLVHRPPRRLEP